MADVEGRAGAYVELMAWWVERVVELAGVDRAAAWADCTPIVGLLSPARWESIREPVDDPGFVGAVVGAYRASIAGLSGARASSGRTPSCFWHELEDDGRQVRIHFSNREGSGVLGEARRLRRRAELAGTLEAARRESPSAERIRGGSWLYHLEAYRVLFPASFLARAVPADPRNELARMALWGQFLRGDRGLFTPGVERFVDGVRRASSMDELVAAFPLTKLDLVGPLDEVLDWLRAG